MTKTSKKLLLSALLAVVIATCLCLFAACGGTTPTDDAVKYTVTVMTDETTPAAGVSVKVKKGGAAFPGKTTGADGKAEFDLSPDNYKVELSSLPAHYSVPDNADLSLTAEKRETTVTLEKNFAYTVTLVNPDNTPYYAAGVLVGICTMDGNCLAPVALEANGTAIIEATPGDYHVKLTDLPDNALIECDANGYYTGKDFSATDTEMTITVYPVTIINAGTAMTGAEKTAYAEAHSDLNTEYEAYKATAQVEAGKVAYFAVKADFTSFYYLFNNGAVTYNFDTSSGIFYSNPLIKNGERFLIFARNTGNAAATAEVVVSVPFSSHISVEGKGAAMDARVGKANTNAIIEFTPTEAGTYTLSVSGGVTTAVSVSNTKPAETASGVEESEYKQNASKATVIHLDKFEAKTPVYFAITAKSSVDFRFTIEKTAATQDSRVYKEVQATLTPYAKPANKSLHGVPMDGTAQLVLKDGVYHLDSEDGPEVVVKITSALDIDRFGEGGRLAYLDLDVNSRFAKYEVISYNAQKDILTINNYANFIRGFIGYEMDDHRNPIIPTHIETETYYAKFVNEDGVYPLTAELKTFLEEFYAANSEAFYFSVPEDTATGCEWLFPCYYYDAEIEQDAIVGEYKFVSLKEDGTSYNIGDEYEGIALTAESFKLVISEDGSYKILMFNPRLQDYDESMPKEAGTWKKEGSVYTFTNMGFDYTSATFNSATGELTLIDTSIDLEWKFVQPASV